MVPGEGFYTPTRHYKFEVTHYTYMEIMICTPTRPSIRFPVYKEIDYWNEEPIDLSEPTFDTKEIMLDRCYVWSSTQYLTIED